MADVQEILADRFAAALTEAFGPEHAATDPSIRPAQDPRFGDYQANLAMGLAKTLKAKPRDVAQKIVAKLSVANICTKVEIAGPGFINLHLSPEFLGGQIAALSGDERLGVQEEKAEGGSRKAEAGTGFTDQRINGLTTRVVLDYSQPNVAKEMHVGHLRSTVIGDCLARVLGFAGQEVIRQNHMGDWGTQFGMLIEHIIDEGWEATKRPSDQATKGSQPAGQEPRASSLEPSSRISDLNALYQAAKKKFDADPAFATRARSRVVLLQGGDKATLDLWRLLMDESKVHFNAVYQRLGVLLTDSDICAESFYNPQLPGMVAELEKLGLAKESRGALCVFPPGFKTPEGEPQPLIIRKSDGGFLYATTDLAALHYRIFDLKATRIIYVVDARQKQHFAMVFKTVEQAGWLKGGVSLEHVAFGTVLGEDGKPFKTRSGETVKLIELLNEAEERAFALVTAKSADMPEADRRAVAHAVGIGAIKYADLSNDRIKDYVFSWDRMLSFDGNTAPYLQNAYVRIKSIFRKAAARGIDVPPEAKAGSQPPQSIALAEAAERALALKLLQFPAAVFGVVESLEPHRLCTYLYELATAYHQFYEKCPVLDAEEATRRSRLAMCELTARTLQRGLGLLGIETVEQM